MCDLHGQCASENDGGAIITDGGGADNICANVTLNTEHTTPNIVLILDLSTSMNEDFGTGSRWTVLRDTLLETPGGLIDSLQSSVRFGLATFNGFSDDFPVCPNMELVNPALNNYAAINTVLSAGELHAGTPTGESIQAVLANPSLAMSTPDPTVFVLATDGAPNGCAGVRTNGKPASVAAVTDAFEVGIRTYVIGVGRSSDLDDDHLTDLANAGLGAPSSADSMFWRVTDDASLIAALQTIIGGTVSCDIELTNGSIDTSNPAAYCAGSSVLLNGNPVACEDPNGWHAVDATHIRLQGTSCDELTATGGEVTATFPCSIILF